MGKKISIGGAVSVLLFAAQLVAAPEVLAQGMLHVVSEKTVTGFVHPESVGCDADAKVLYVSEFGSELKPTLKDGKGRISKVSLSGEVLEQRFLPAAGVVLNKPKGIWVQGGHLWVTDIDSVWEFDLQSRKGRKVDIPGIQFANDPAVMGNALYVTDNRGDQLYRIEPAEFLSGAGEPKVSLVTAGQSMNPNGVYPARDGSLLLVGFKSKEEARGIFSLDAMGKLVNVSKGLGRLDGVAQLDDGTLLVTNWDSGSLFSWSKDGTMTDLAKGFTGPADFCVMSDGAELLVVVPDLVKSELRLVRLAK